MLGLEKLLVLTLTLLWKRSQILICGVGEVRDAFKKKNYVDRETVPKVGRGGSTIPL